MNGSTPKQGLGEWFLLAIVQLPRTVPEEADQSFSEELFT
jgi:hypothetical protein